MAILLRSTAEKYESRGSIAGVRVSYIEIVDGGSRSFSPAYRYPTATLFRFVRLRVCVSTGPSRPVPSVLRFPAFSPEKFHLVRSSPILPGIAVLGQTNTPSLGPVPPTVLPPFPPSSPLQFPRPITMLDKGSAINRHFAARPTSATRPIYPDACTGDSQQPFTGLTRCLPTIPFSAFPDRTRISRSRSILPDSSYDLPTISRTTDRHDSSRNRHYSRADFPKPRPVRDHACSERCLSARPSGRAKRHELSAYPAILPARVFVFPSTDASLLPVRLNARCISPHGSRATPYALFIARPALHAKVLSFLRVLPRICSRPRDTLDCY